ncbi:MAG: FKBP-type peptidyl-prolyl cis-trans isomerase [Sphingobacteriales bacterium]|nr:FKBP-type peptidyl-prolyl cis-trans isomerase [Sphingobacteriales bacterium]
MKKTTLLLFLLVITIAGLAQTGNTKPVTKTTTPVFKNNLDSASYAIGMSVANFYSQQGVTKLNTALVLEGMKTVLAKKPTLLNDAGANMAITKCLNSLSEEKAKFQITQGKNFLAANKTKPNVKTTASGLQYEVMTEGTGEKPKETDRVSVNYKGTFLNGVEFDNSSRNNAPVTFGLNQVIRGWTEGLQLMSVGSKYRFWVPYTLGYGINDYGNIPGGSLLVFEVELVEIVK